MKKSSPKLLLKRLANNNEDIPRAPFVGNLLLDNLPGLGLDRILLLLLPPAVELGHGGRNGLPDHLQPGPGYNQLIHFLVNGLATTMNIEYRLQESPSTDLRSIWTILAGVQSKQAIPTLSDVRSYYLGVREGGKVDLCVASEIFLSICLINQSNMR